MNSIKSSKPINLLLTMLCFALFANAQQSKRVLFIGNSYTYVNDLPSMLVDAASSTGDLVNPDYNAPGGHTLQQHSTNNTTLAKIAGADWHYVVLQEQSQWPSFPESQVQSGVYPYARKLDSIINAQHPCAETIFYMTWGRKNGDAQNCVSWPPVCTYQGMDSLLQLRYTQMAEDNNALLSPVGKVWRAIRQQFPALELYQADESHPSVAGTYAAACTFYSIIFRKDPTLISWNSTLTAADALNIRNIAKSVVFEHLADFNVGAFDPEADFTFQANAQTVQFQNTSVNAGSYSWDFGDGTTSTDENPVHTFTGSGPFEVKLIVANCELGDTLIQEVNLVAALPEFNNETLHISPNPSEGTLQVMLGKTMEKGTQIEIFQPDGKMVFAKTIRENCKIAALDITNLPDGMYFVSVQISSGIKYQQKLQVCR